MKRIERMTDSELSELTKKLSNEQYEKGYDPTRALKLALIRDEMNTRAGRVANSISRLSWK